ncbi:MAG: DUF58 domain-containing protein [Planctomycetaceae bacterium]|nr:DUF58 domain-containing protein [Planctomycetaceae bacterium]
MESDRYIVAARRLARAYRLVPPATGLGGVAGSFLGRREGESIDFHDYRQYHPGDDLRRVDWRAYARSKQMHLRLFREEVSPLVELHLDTSASMGAYPGKAAAAVFAAAFLAEATLASDGRPVLCADGTRHSGGGLLKVLANCHFTTSGPAAHPLSTGGARPLRILLSDFLWEGGAARYFHQGASGGVGFVPVAILSHSEIDPPWRGLFRLSDVEDDAATVDIALGEKTLGEYKARLRQHRNGLEREARRYGCPLLWWETPDAELRDGDMERLVAFFLAERLVTLR